MEQSPQRDKIATTDALRIYGLSFDFPLSHRLEFDPKFTREEGSVAIKSPSNAVVFVSWGDLRKIVKKLPNPEEHSKFSVERVVKHTQGRLTIVEQKEIMINGHRAAYKHVRVEAPKGPIIVRRRDQEIESLHLHCDRTSRYFVIYTNVQPDRLGGVGQDDTLKIVAATFKCH
jgi:hypothetical protein